MNISSKILCVAVAASTVALTSCNGSRGVFSSPLYLAVTVEPRPVSVAQGGTVVLSATVSNNLSLPAWNLLYPDDTSNAGTLTAVAGSPNSILYTAPPQPPIYGNGVPAGFTQGTVTVQTSVNPPSGSTLPVAHDSVTFFITSPTVSFSGISPLLATVALNGGTQQFAAYEVGSANNALTWQVNGITGGSPDLVSAGSVGMIDRFGLYTAPAKLPSSNTVTVTVIVQADPTKTGSAVVSLQ